MNPKPEVTTRGKARPIPAFIAALVALVIACGGGDAPLPGTHLDGAPAPDFRLTDQAGRDVSMSGMRGRPVVLTFLYTSCPDFCPLTAEKLRQTLEQLGKSAGKVEIVAVSVDPQRDDRQAAQTFTTAHGLPEANWHYLTGAEAELAPVWAAYGIARLERASGSPAPGASAVDALGHTEALYVIDSDGRERTLLRGDFRPADLADGLRNLIK